MNAATSFSPTALQIFELFKTLPVDEQESVRENLLPAQSADDFDVPDWHWNVLEERERLHQQGLDPAIPVEEAFQYIRGQLRTRRQAL